MLEGIRRERVDKKKALCQILLSRAFPRKTRGADQLHEVPVSGLAHCLIFEDTLTLKEDLYLPPWCSSSCLKANEAGYLYSEALATQKPWLHHFSLEMPFIVEK